MYTIVKAINSAGRAFVAFSVPMLIQSGVLVIILLLADLLLRRKVRAVFRYWIWMLVLVKLVLPVSLWSPLSVGSWFGGTLAAPLEPRQIEPRPVSSIESITSGLTTEPVAPVTRVAAASDSLPMETLHVDRSTPAAPVPSVAPAAPIPSPKPAPSLSWQGLVFLIWAAVAAALLLLLLQRAAFVRGLAARTDPAPAGLAASLDECRRRMGVLRPISLRISPYATSPAVCGLLRPAILIPQGLAAKLQAHEVCAVLMHELAHVKRGDLWVNVAQTLLQIVYFYNPLLWVANAMIRRVREQAVDETVLVAMGETAGEYPQTLVNIARLALANRPTLSLRLIGVVESKSALTARIKHILTHPTPNSARLGLLGVLAITILAAVLLPMARRLEPRFTVVNNGPLDIRLVGVCPDSSEELYDASGKKLDNGLGPAGAWELTWRPDSQHRDFFFEFPIVPGQLLLLPFPRLYQAGTDHGLGGGFNRWFEPDANSLGLVQSMTFARTYPRVFYFLRWSTPIDRVDLTLRYFYGPRREAICTFTGPFSEGKSIQADEGRPYRLVPKVVSAGYLEPDTQFGFTTKQPFDYDTVAVAYDLDGRRYLLEQGGGQSGSQGANIRYRGLPLPLDKIAAITIGEKPHEITFKNVVIHYPDRLPRTHAEFLDRIGERLRLSTEQLERYEFASPQEAVEVIDVVRGEAYEGRVLQALTSARPSVRISDMNEAAQEKIHRAATAWVQSGRMAGYGLVLGLLGKWPEFFDLAIARLVSAGPSSNYRPEQIKVWFDGNRGIAQMLIGWGQLNDSQVQQIEQCILRTSDGGVIGSLLSCLTNTRSQASVDALWELAQDDRPWIWWRAIYWWSNLSRTTDRVPDDLPEKMKLRLILARNIRGDESLRAKAAALLPELFTAKLWEMDSSDWNTVRERIARELDKKAATQVYVDYLRQVQTAMTEQQGAVNGSFQYNAKWMVVSVIRTLNVWYALDMGHLGTDETSESYKTEPRTLPEFQKLVAEVIQWYDVNKELKPVELPLTGQVVDTAGHPIADAQLSFAKREDVPTPYGGSTQRKVEIGMRRTDAQGRYTFGDFGNGELLSVDIVAAGFMPRREQHISRLTDGRYRLDPNSIVVMQRAGSISGVVLGLDGAPLGNARFRVSLDKEYSYGTPRSSFVTDAQGRFAINDVPAGPVILSYVETRRATGSPGFSEQYAGRCAATVLDTKEGGQLTDAVLDLSKSVCSLEITFVDGAGKPVTATMFTLSIPTPGGRRRYAEVFATKEVSANGVYRFEGLPPGNLHVMMYGEARFLTQLDVAFTPQETARYRVALGSPESSGKLTSPSGPVVAIVASDDTPSGLQKAEVRR